MEQVGGNTDVPNGLNWPSDLVRDDTNMKQMKTCSSAHLVIILTILLAGCGNKGPLERPASAQEPVPAEETADAETEQKEPKK